MSARSTEAYLFVPELFRYNDTDVREVNGRRMPFGLMGDQQVERRSCHPMFSC